MANGAIKNIKTSNQLTSESLCATSDQDIGFKSRKENSFWCGEHIGKQGYLQVIYGGYNVLTGLTIRAVSEEFMLNQIALDIFSSTSPNWTPVVKDDLHVSRKKNT